MRNLIKILLVLLLIISTDLLAQNKQDYSNDPGYADFGNLSGFEKGNNVTEIYIGKDLLDLVAKMSQEKDSSLTNLLEGLKLIRVNSFSVNKKDSKAIMLIMNKVDKNLTDKNWKRIVKIKNNNNVTNVYIKSDNEGNFDGLVVTNFQKDGEASFINIVGRIKLETIGKLGKKFNIPELGKIKNK